MDRAKLNMYMYTSIYRKNNINEMNQQNIATEDNNNDNNNMLKHVTTCRPHHKNE